MSAQQTLDVEQAVAEAWRAGYEAGRRDADHPASLPSRRQPTISAIKSAVAESYQISLDALLAADTARERAWPRQMAMYLARRLTTHSAGTIARHFHRDRTTVVYAVAAVEQRRGRYPAIDARIERLSRELARGQRDDG